jgi:hypothetical protein
MAETKIVGFQVDRQMSGVILRVVSNDTKWFLYYTDDFKTFYPVMPFIEWRGNQTIGVMIEHLPTQRFFVVRGFK